MIGLYIGVAMASSAALVFEIALTRIFASSQGYHFGFLAISLALLGFGASGTLLSLAPAWSRRANRSTLGLLALIFSISIPSSYLAANYLPFDAYRVAWEPFQFVYLASYLLALVVPFFLAGLLQGLALVHWPSQTAPIYSANLIGSGLGCLIALGALDLSDGPGTVVAAAVIASAAAFAFALPSQFETGGELLSQWLTRWLSVLVIVLLASLLPQVPTWLDARLSPYKPLSQILNYPGTRIIYQAWNAFSHVDVVDSPSLHSAPGLSLSYAGEMPQQTGVVVDADNILTLTSRDNLSPGFFDSLPMSLPYLLRPNARALVIEPGGGMDVLIASNRGARSVMAVEQNPLITNLIEGQYAERAGFVFSQPNVQVANTSGRAYVARNSERFDVIDLALSENFHAVSVGAFALSENYLMTTESFRGYLARLEPNGILVIQRWLQLPPTEEIRAAGLVIAALEGNGVSDPGQHIVAIRSFSTMLILASREAFAPSELEQIKSFAVGRQYDLVYYPGIKRSEANRFNVLQSDLYFESFQGLLSNAAQFNAQYDYDIAPPTDGHPFFFQSFKWSQTPTVLALLRRTWQPFGGSGFLILLALLGLVLFLSALLIIPPIILAQNRRRRDHALGLTRPLIYFASVGLGFLFVEIPLIERFILFLDNPVYSFGVVLFALLVFSGMGSLTAERMPWRAGMAALIVAIGVYYLGLPSLFALFLRLDFTPRVFVAILALAPLGFLLGVPFPRGLRLLTRQSLDLVPIAWGVNGFVSVVSSVLATLIALTWGFSFVLLGAGLAYGVALASIQEAGDRRH